LKIAVASSDGIVVNRHFGRADKFYIYEKEDENIRFLEVRWGLAFCRNGEHEEIELKNAVELIDDCRVLLVLQIGSVPKDLLFHNNTVTYCVKGYVEDVLKLVNNSNHGGN